MSARKGETMNQKDRLRQIRNLDPDIQSHELNSVEKSILSVLQTNYQQDRTIDVSWLQSECTRIGFSPKEFSHGFIKLLIRGHMEPRGDFAYVLAGGNNGMVCHEDESAYGAGHANAGGPLLPEQQLRERGVDSQPGRIGILLVDDDDDVRNVVKDMLEDAHYRVHIAENGKEAISIFRDNADSIDLLVSDVVMPMMNGKEVYEQLSKVKPGLPAVFISGYPSDILKQLYTAKNVKFLAKPLKQSILIKAIQALLPS